MSLRETSFFGIGPVNITAIAMGIACERSTVLVNKIIYGLVAQRQIASNLG